MIGIQLDVIPYFQRLQAELAKLDMAAVQRMAERIYRAWADQRFVFLFGNGGSAAFASHLAEDLGKGTLRAADLRNESQRRLKVLSLTDNTPWLTALANDVGYDQVFVQQIMHYGQPGDLAIAVSGSGNSPNVLAAVDWANRHGLISFGVTGYSGGKLKQMQQDGLHIALDDMGMVESIHGCVIHWVVDELYARINGEGRYAK